MFNSLGSNITLALMEIMNAKKIESNYNESCREKSMDRRLLDISVELQCENVVNNL